LFGARKSSGVWQKRAITVLGEKGKTMLLTIDLSEEDMRWHLLHKRMGFLDPIADLIEETYTEEYCNELVSGERKDDAV